MIPKIIHYCWFGRNPMPALAQKCIRSWRKYCPDYEIIEWNEDNFDISSTPLYVRQAYEAKKWAFVTDYVRLKLIYDYGGIYLDTDVELLHSLDSVLQYDGFFGFEGKQFVATGLGFGGVKELCVLKDMMEDYRNIPFIKDNGEYDLLPCPQRNTEVLMKYGLIQDGMTQVLNGHIKVFSNEVMCPMNYITGEVFRTDNTMSIHWFSASWKTDAEKKKHKKMMAQIKRKNIIHNLVHVPNRILSRCLGSDRYERLKRAIKG